MQKNENIDNRAIGKRMRQERENLGLSRESFAEIVGLSSYYVGQLERGERQMSLPVTGRICDCLHITLDYLILGKINYADIYDAQETKGAARQITNEAFDYDDRYDSDEGTEIKRLLNKCSPKELELINKIIKTILPYLKR